MPAVKKKFSRKTGGSAERVVKRVRAIPVAVPERQPTPSGVRFTFELVTPEIATSWLEGKCANRNISDSHVQRLASDMRRGQWERNGETIKFTTDGRLVDGQHRLWAVIVANVPVWMDVARGVSEQAMLTVDTNRVRTFAGFLQITDTKASDSKMVAATARWLHWYQATMHRADQGVPDMWSLGSHKATHRELQELVQNWPELYEGVRMARQAPKGSAIPKATIAFVYTGAMREDPELAQQFMVQVNEGLELGASSPVLRLRERMMAQRVTKREVDRIYAAALTMKAWRLFADGKTVGRLFLGEKEKFPKFKWPE